MCIRDSDEVQQLINRLIDEDANRRAGRIVEQFGHQQPDPGSGMPPAPPAPPR